LTPRTTTSGQPSDSNILSQLKGSADDGDVEPHSPLSPPSTSIDDASQINAAQEPVVAMSLDEPKVAPWLAKLLEKMDKKHAETKARKVKGYSNLNLNIDRLLRLLLQYYYLRPCTIIETSPSFRFANSPQLHIIQMGKHKSEDAMQIKLLKDELADLKSELR
jgi:hypothetical protein